MQCTVPMMHRFKAMLYIAHRWPLLLLLHYSCVTTRPDQSHQGTTSVESKSRSTHWSGNGARFETETATETETMCGHVVLRYFKHSFGLFSEKRNGGSPETNSSEDSRPPESNSRRSPRGETRDQKLVSSRRSSDPSPPYNSDTDIITELTPPWVGRERGPAGRLHDKHLHALRVIPCDCVCVCVRACVRVRVCVCVWWAGSGPCQLLSAGQSGRRPPPALQITGLEDE